MKGSLRIFYGDGSHPFVTLLMIHPIKELWNTSVNFSGTSDCLACSFAWWILLNFCTGIVEWNPLRILCYAWFLLEISDKF